MWCSEKQMEFAQNIGNRCLCKIWHRNQWYVYTYLVVLWLRTFPQAPRNPGGRKICLRGVSKNNCQASDCDYPFFMTIAKKLQLSYRVEAVVEQHSTLLSGFVWPCIGDQTDCFVSRSAWNSSSGVVLRSVITGSCRQQTGCMAEADEGHKCVLRAAKFIPFEWSEAPRHVSCCLMPPFAVICKIISRFP